MKNTCKRKRTTKPIKNRGIFDYGIRSNQVTKRHKRNEYIMKDCWGIITLFVELNGDEFSSQLLQKLLHSHTVWAKRLAAIPKINRSDHTKQQTHTPLVHKSVQIHPCFIIVIYFHVNMHTIKSNIHKHRLRLPNMFINNH